MLRALYDYGMAHRDRFPIEGYADRSVHFIVAFGADGSFLGARKPEAKKITAPYIPGLTSGSVANVLMEKAEVAIRLDSGNEGRRLKTLEAKQLCFLKYFRDGLFSVPSFGIVLQGLSDEQVLGDIQSAVMLQGGTAASVIAFSVDGVLLSDMPETADWWREYRRVMMKGTGVRALDIVTGEVCEPVRLFKQLPVSAAGGGQPTGVALISFNEDSSCSYGAKQGLNAPMAAETASVIMDAMTYLGNRGIRFGDMRVLHWYAFDKDSDKSGDPDVPEVLRELFSGVSAPEPDDGKAKAAGAEAQADRLVRSVFKGGALPDTGNSAYHVIVMKPDAARVSIRYYGTGSYEQLYAALESWFDDMRLVIMDGRGMTRNRSLGYLVESLSPVVSGKRKAEAVSSLYQPMLMASLGLGEIPVSAASFALARIRSMSFDGFSDKNRTIPFQVLKLYLNRRRNIKQEEKLMAELNPGLKSIGYQCGRLLAVYEDLQGLAMNKHDMLSHYYAGCSQNPMSVLGRLQSLASYYIGKISSKQFKDWYTDLFSGIYMEIQGDIPKMLTVTEQAYFAVGYWHQVAFMRQEWGKYIESKKRKKRNDTGDVNDGIEEVIEDECE